MIIKNLKVIILLGVMYSFLGMKNLNRTSMSQFSLINYKPYTSELTNKGLSDLDSFAFLFCKYDQLHNGGIIYITPYNLKSEYEQNPYIGIDRFRNFVNVLKVKHQIKLENSIYFQDKDYDSYYVNDSRTGLHISISPRQD
jgi:hypothetical protein